GPSSPTRAISNAAMCVTGAMRDAQRERMANPAAMPVSRPNAMRISAWTLVTGPRGMIRAAARPDVMAAPAAAAIRVAGCAQRASFHRLWTLPPTGACPRGWVWEIIGGLLPKAAAAADGFRRLESRQRRVKKSQEGP